MNLVKIKELAEKRAGGLKKLAKDIDMSEANLHRCINANKIQANDLEKITSIFNIPIGCFFDDMPSGNITNAGSGNQVVTHSGTVTISEYEKENAHLRALLEEKERTIKILMNKN
jgi:DNA-binding Xre family transcriptional regulator